MIVTFEGPCPGGDNPTFTHRRLFRVWKNEVTSVREATDSELAAYDDASALLSDFGRGDQLLIASEANYDELAEAVVKVHQERDSVSSKVDHFANAFTMNRRLVSYLSSRRLYLDFSRARLVRRYGKRSAELKSFNDVRSSLYEQEFSYRFAEELRNYSQHFGFPIGHVRGTERIDLEANVESSSVNVCFDLRDLVHVGPDFWRKLRPELEAMEPLLPVVPAIDVLPDQLRIIRDRMLDTEKPVLEAAVDNIFATLRDPDEPGRSLRVGRWINNNGRLGFEYDDLPSWEIRHLSIRATEGLP